MSQSLIRVWNLWVARNKEFYRDRSVLSWNFIFPFLVVFGFGYAFKSDNQVLYKVAVYPPKATFYNEPNSLLTNFLATRYVQFVPVEQLEPALEKLRNHKYDMLISANDLTQGLPYWINSTSPKGYFLERVLRGSQPTSPAQPALVLVSQKVFGKETRYVDWLIPGIVCMNIMFASIFGLGYTIVRYRKNGVLKRFKGTPLTPLEFLASQVLSRLFLIIVSAMIIFVGCKFLVDFKMVGSYVSLFSFISLGAICLMSVSLLIAAQVSSDELAGGLLNMISMPMMFLSGIWFSLEGSQKWVIAVTQLLPMTHLVEGCRAIMLEGATLWDIRQSIVILGVLSVVSVALSARLFRWQ